MEALKLSDVFPVQRPRLTAIEETREHDCFVHFDFHGRLHVSMLHNLGAQATEGLALLICPTISFFVEVPEMINHLQLPLWTLWEARQAAGHG